MANTYSITAKVDQIVTKEIDLTVVANSQEEAENTARTALGVFPKEVPGTDVVKLIVTKSTYWIPRGIELTKVKEDKQVD